MTDIVERLREWANDNVPRVQMIGPMVATMLEAADEIERLRNDRSKWLTDCADEIQRLRKENKELNAAAAGDPSDRA